MVAHKATMLRMLRTSATLPRKLNEIVERNFCAMRTSRPAGRKCRPSRHGTKTVVRFTGALDRSEFDSVQSRAGLRGATADGDGCAVMTVGPRSYFEFGRGVLDSTAVS